MMRMTHCVVLLMAFAVGSASAQQEAATLASTVEINVRSHAWCDPEEVAIGEPFTLYLDVVHDSEERVFLDQPSEGEDEFGLGWVVLEQRSVRRLPLSDEPGHSLTQARWRLFALEAGELELQSVGADCALAGVISRLEPVTASIRVRHELADGEDEARPPVTFRELPGPVVSPLRSNLLLAAAVLLLLGARLWWRALRHCLWILRGRSSAASEVPPTPLERLAAVDPASEGKERETFFLLSRVVREAIDAEAFDGTSAPALDGLTDEEWVVARRERNGIASERLERVARLFAVCEGVKYGGQQPTRWTVEEALEEARHLCVVGESKEVGE